MSQPTLITDVIAGADSSRSASRAAQAGDSGSDFRNAFDTQLKRSESFSSKSSEETPKTHQAKSEKHSATVAGEAHGQSSSATRDTAPAADSEDRGNVQDVEEAPGAVGDPAAEPSDAVTVTLDAAAVTSSVVDGGSALPQHAMAPTISLESLNAAMTPNMTALPTATASTLAADPHIASADAPVSALGLVQAAGANTPARVTASTSTNPVPTSAADAGMLDLARAVVAARGSAGGGDAGLAGGTSGDAGQSAGARSGDAAMGFANALNAVAAQRPSSLAATAVAPSLPPLEARLGTSQWGQMLGARVAFGLASGFTTATLAVNPPELGPVQIALSLADDEASVQFSANHAPVRDAIEAAMPRLREALAEEGIRLGDVSVGSGETGSADERDEATAQQDDARDADTGSDGDSAVHANVQVRMSEGLIDTFA